MLESTAFNSASTVQNLLFSRVSPLLLLKIIPKEAFTKAFNKEVCIHSIHLP